MCNNHHVIRLYGSLLSPLPRQVQWCHTEIKTVLIFNYQLFVGNTDGNTVVNHDLNPPIGARYIRFRPKGYHTVIAMRVELYGCPGNKGFHLFNQHYRTLCVAMTKKISILTISSFYLPGSFWVVRCSIDKSYVCQIWIWASSLRVSPLANLSSMDMGPSLVLALCFFHPFPWKSKH